MSINLSKPPVPIADPVEKLRSSVVARIYDSYFDSSARLEVHRYGTVDLGMDPSKVLLVMDMELEEQACANEHRLLQELEDLLHRFTDKDKKLDQKERSDAIQLVCKAKSGYAKGLAFDSAERRVIEFCRTNRVKVKIGFMRWDIP